MSKNKKSSNLIMDLAIDNLRIVYNLFLFLNHILHILVEKKIRNLYIIYIYI